MHLRLGTRPSNLALKQAREIKKIFPQAKFEVVVYRTKGDKDKLTPLSEVEGSDFFTRELDEALLSGEIDAAVHSSKDLPEKLAGGLAVIFESQALSPNDALVSKTGLKLLELPSGSRVGASSNRRKKQIKALRSDLEIIDVRGDIEERLGLLDNNSIDALIVAHAALVRLGLEKKASEILSVDIFKPHPKQGKLSLVTRKDLCQKVRSILLVPAPGTGN